MWSDTNQNPPVLKLWNGSAWIPATVALGSVAPTGTLTTGQLWSDTNTVPATLKAWNGTAWVPVQAAGGSGTVTAVTGTAPIAIATGTTTPVISITPGTNRQLLETNGGVVGFASNIDIPGTLDVTGVATFDGIASHPAGTAAAPSVTFTGDTNTGFYSPGADRIGFANNGVGTVEVTAAGDVLVGGTLPGTPNVTVAANGTVSVGVSGDAVGVGARLDGTGVGSTVFNAYGLNANSTNNSVLMYAPTTAPGAAVLRALFNTDGSLKIGGTLPATPNVSLLATGRLQLGQSGDGVSVGAAIDGTGTGSTVFNAYGLNANSSNNSILMFAPTSAPGPAVLRSLFHTDGSLKIGGTLPASPNILLSAAGTATATPQTVSSTFLSDRNASFLGAHYDANQAGTQVFVVFFNGDVRIAPGRTYGNLSDESVKENIEDATPKLDDVCQLKVRNFTVKGEEPEAKYIGFIAQEFEQVFPSLVQEDEKGLKGIKESALTSILVKSLQEAVARIEALEAEVAALKLS